MSSLCFFFLFLSTLSSTSSRSRSRLWQRCHLTTVVVVLGLAFPSTVAGSVQNVSTTELIISPSSAWQITDGTFLATNTPGASVTYECRQPCTGIEFILVQPAGETGQVSACLDCIDAPSNTQSNSTNYVLVNTQSLISYQGLSSDLHTLQITTHSTTTLFVGSVEVDLSSDDDDSSPSSSSDSPGSSDPNPTSASGINTASAEPHSHSTASSSSSSSSSKSTDGSSGEKLSSSSSSSKVPITAIAAGAGAAVLVLLAAILICLHRRRKQRRSRSGAAGGNRLSRWQNAVLGGGGGGGGGGDGFLSDEEHLQKGSGRPSSPMLETFRSSRDLEADYYGYGYIPTESKSLGGGRFGGLPRSAVPFASIPGGASRASLDDDDMDRGSYNINSINSPGRGLSSIAEDGGRLQIKKSLNRRTSIPSIYSAYSDPWQTVEDDYYYNSDAEDDPSGPGPNAKAERLKANLNLNTNAGGKRNTTATTRTRRDTTVSVKNMLNDLNDAIRTGADTFAWKPSTTPGGGGDKPPPVPAVPMQFLSPNSATVGRKQTKGHKPSRSTDVLI